MKSPAGGIKEVHARHSCETQTHFTPRVDKQTHFVACRSMALCHRLRHGVTGNLSDSMAYYWHPVHCLQTQKQTKPKAAINHQQGFEMLISIGC